MPIVGKKKYPYTDKGKQMAYEHSARTNEPIREVTNYAASMPSDFRRKRKKNEPPQQSY